MLSGSLNRRTLLRGIAATAALSTIPTASASLPGPDDFSNTINVVDAGADPTGQESVSDLLRDLLANDTKLVFPEGRYRMDSQVRFTGYDGVCLEGDNATLAPANYHEFEGPTYRLFRLGTHYAPGKNCRITGFEIDQTADSTGIRAFECYVTDGLFVDDITIRGEHDSGTKGPGLFCVTDPEGAGMVKRFRARDGGAWNDETPHNELWRGPTGILVSGYHYGHLEFKDCELGGFPDNGLYAVTNGRVDVVGGHYWNSEAASIRLGGHDCLVTRALVEVTGHEPQSKGQRGIRFDNGTNMRVRDTEINITDPNQHALSILSDVESASIRETDISITGGVGHGIVCQPGSGDVEIARCNIHIDDGGHAILIRDGPGQVTAEYCDITGDADGASSRGAIRCERPGAELRMIAVDQPNPDRRRGMDLIADDITVFHCNVYAGHRPLTVRGERVLVEECDLQSYSDEPPALIGSPSRDVTVKENTLKNNLDVDSCPGLSVYSNTWL